MNFSAIISNMLPAVQQWQAIRRCRPHFTAAKWVRSRGFRLLESRGSEADSTDGCLAISHWHGRAASQKPGAWRDFVCGSWTGSNPTFLSI